MNTQILSQKRFIIRQSLTKIVILASKATKASTLIKLAKLHQVDVSSLYFSHEFNYKILIISKLQLVFEINQLSTSRKTCKDFISPNSST
jgi:hypothetical protein